MSGNILAAIIFIFAISIITFVFYAVAIIVALVYKFKNHDRRSIEDILDGNY